MRFYILIFFSLVALATVAQSKMVNKEYLGDKIWVLKKEEGYSPWHSKIIPIFLSFKNDSDLVVRGYGANSEKRYPYLLTKDTLKVGEDRYFKIKSVSDHILVLGIDGDYYDYFSLPVEPESTIDSIKLSNTIVDRRLWELHGNVLEFLSENVSLTREKTYKVIEHHTGQKFFGTYFLDIYNEYVFLVILIDGRHSEMFYRVLGYTTDEIELIEVKYGHNSERMIALRK